MSPPIRKQIGGEVRAGIIANKDIFSPVLEATKKERLKGEPLSLYTGQPDSRFKVKSENGQTVVTFVYPLDTDESVKTGRLFAVDRFVFDPKEKKLLSFNRSYGIPRAWNSLADMKHSDYWKSVLENLKKGKSLTEESPSVAKFFADVVLKLPEPPADGNPPVVDEAVKDLPDEEDFLTTDQLLAEPPKEPEGLEIKPGAPAPLPLKAPQKLEIGAGRGLIGPLKKSSKTLEEAHLQYLKLLLPAIFASLDKSEKETPPLFEKGVVALENGFLPDGNPAFEKLAEYYREKSNPDQAIFVRGLNAVSRGDLFEARRQFSFIERRHTGAAVLIGWIDHYDQSRSALKTLDLMKAVVSEKIDKQREGDKAWVRRLGSVFSKENKTEKEAKEFEGLFGKIKEKILQGDAYTIEAAMAQVQAEGGAQEAALLARLKSDKFLDGALLDLARSGKLKGDLRAQTQLAVAREKLVPHEYFQSANGTFMEVASGSSNPKLAAAAKKSAGMLTGTGSAVDATELGLMRATTELSNPVTIGSLFLGNAAFTFARYGALARWGGLGVRSTVLATGMGVAAEAPTFELGRRFLSSAFVGGDNWKPKEVLQGIGSNLVSFGAMRGAGLGVRLGLEPLPENLLPFGRATLPVASHMASFGSLFAVNEAERALGFRPKEAPTWQARAMLDGIFYAQVGMTARLGESFLGPTLGKKIHELDRFNELVTRMNRVPAARFNKPISVDPLPEPPKEETPAPPSAEAGVDALAAEVADQAKRTDQLAADGAQGKVPKTTDPELRAARIEIDRLRVALEGTERELATARSKAAEVDGAKARVAEVEAQLAEAGARLGEKEAQLGTETRRVGELMSRVEEVLRDLRTANEDKAGAVGRASSAEAKEAEARGKVGGLERNLEQARAGLEAARREVADEKGKKERSEARVGELEGKEAAAGARVGELEGELAAARADLEAARREAGEAKAAKGEAERRAAELAGKETEARTQAADLEIAKGRLEAANTKLERDLGTLRTRVAEVEGERDRAKQDLADKTAELGQALEGERDQAQRALAAKTAELGEAQAAQAELQRRNEEVWGERNRALDEVFEKEKALGEARHKVGGLETRIKVLEQEKAEATRAIEAKEQELAGLRDQVAEAGRKLATLESLRHELGTARAELESTKVLLEGIKKENERLRTHLKEAIEGRRKSEAEYARLIEGLRENIRERDERIEALEAEKRKVEGDLGRETARAEAAEGREAGLRGQIEGLNKKVEGLERDLEAERRKVAGLDRQLEVKDKKLAGKVKDIEGLRGQIDRAGKLREILNGKIGEKEQALVEARKELNRLTKENRRLAEENQRQKELLEAEDVSAIAKSEEEIALEARVAELEGEKGRLEARLGRETEALGQKTAALEQAGRDLEGLRGEIAGLNSELEGRRDEVAGFRGRETDLNAAIEGLRGDLRGKGEEIQGLREANEALAAKAEAVRLEAETAAARAGAAEARALAAEAGVEALGKELELARAEANKAAAGQKTELEGQAGELRREVEQYKAWQREAEGRAAEAEAKASRLEGELEGARAAETEARRAFERRDGEARAAEAEVERLRSRLEALEGEKETALSEKQTAEEKLGRAEEALAQKGAEIAQKDRPEGLSAAERDELDALREGLRALQQEIDTVRGERGKIQAQVEGLQKEIDALREELEVRAPGPWFIFDTDPRVAAIQFPVEGRQTLRNNKGEPIGEIKICAGGKEGPLQMKFANGAHVSGETSQAGRSYQQDGFYLARFTLPDGTEVKVIVGADGAGGHTGGELASSAFLQGVHARLAELAYEGKVPTAAELFEHGFKAVDVQKTQDRKYGGATGTGSVLVIVGDQASIATAGDAMVIHAGKNAKGGYEILGYSHVDSLPPNVITNGIHQNNPNVYRVDGLKPGDRFVIGSDGFWENIVGPEYKSSGSNDYRQALGKDPLHQRHFEAIRLMMEATEADEHAGEKFHDLALTNIGQAGQKVNFFGKRIQLPNEADSDNIFTFSYEHAGDPKSSKKVFEEDTPPPPLEGVEGGTIAPFKRYLGASGQENSAFPSAYSQPMANLYGRKASEATAPWAALFKNFPGLEDKFNPALLSQAGDRQTQDKFFKGLRKAVEAPTAEEAKNEFYKKALEEVKKLEGTSKPFSEVSDAEVGTLVVRKVNYRSALQRTFGSHAGEAAKQFARLYKNLPELEAEFNPEQLSTLDADAAKKFITRKLLPRFHTDRARLTDHDLSEGLFKAANEINDLYEKAKGEREAQAPSVAAAAPAAPPPAAAPSIVVLRPRKSYIVGSNGDGSVQIQVLHPHVSRRHCRIFEERGAWYVEDLGSTNGTLLNGQRVEPGRPALIPSQGNSLIQMGEKLVDVAPRPGGNLTFEELMSPASPHPPPPPASPPPPKSPPPPPPSPRGRAEAEAPTVGGARPGGGAPPLKFQKGEVVRLGRAIFSDPAVSTEHLEFRHNGRIWIVRDLGSSNGTWLDKFEIHKPGDPRIAPREVGDWREVKHDSVIKIGNTFLRIKFDLDQNLYVEQISPWAAGWEQPAPPPPVGFAQPFVAPHRQGDSIHMGSAQKLTLMNTTDPPSLYEDAGKGPGAYVLTLERNRLWAETFAEITRYGQAFGIKSMAGNGKVKLFQGGRMVSLDHGHETVIQPGDQIVIGKHRLTFQP